jgi:hypothetical protein
MMIDESDLRQRFARLRDADRERAPSFAHIRARVRVRRNWRAPLRVRPLVIGAAAAAAIGAIWLANARSFSPSTATPAIATWRAPTDILLRTPGRELLGAMPTLGASVLDTMIPKPSNRGTLE